MKIRKNYSNDEKFRDLSRKFESIDKYYSRNCRIQEINFRKVLSDKKESEHLFLSIEDWLQLHLKVHEEIVHSKLELENEMLLNEYYELLKEVGNLKRELIENYSQVTDFNRFYS